MRNKIITLLIFIIFILTLTSCNDSELNIDGEIDQIKISNIKE